MNRRQVQQLAAELQARAIEDILTGGPEGMDHSLPSAQHLIGPSQAEREALLVALNGQVAKLRAQAGPFADRPNREIATMWKRA